MNWLHGLHNRFRVPGFLVNSMPKAGTNLLMKAMGTFPGIRRARVHVTNRLPERRAEAADRGGPTTPIGVDWPRPVDLAGLRSVLRTIGRGRFAHAHTGFSDALAATLSGLGMKTLLILRDPRDVVVSHAKYVAQEANHLLYACYQPLSEEERIMTSIVGLAPSGAGEAGLLDIGTRYRGLLAWTAHPLNCTTRFEWLVGPQGGGEREAQVRELARCARHLGIRCAPGTVERIADGLFGGTRTFRRGVIGGWREVLTDAHLRAVQRVAGDIVAALGEGEDVRVPGRDRD